MKNCVISHVKSFTKNTTNQKKILNLHMQARVAQLVEHKLPKLGVAGSSPVSRSFFLKNHFQHVQRFNVLHITHVYVVV